MTRPKVEPENRKRTPQACAVCKRRKQKCNGIQPCATCTKRGTVCEYDGNYQQHAGGTLNVMGLESRYRKDPKPSRSFSSESSSIVEYKEESKDRVTLETISRGPHGFLDRNSNSAQYIETLINKEEPSRTPTKPQNSVESGNEEEAEVYKYTRMLEDPRGRLLYVGDSATLSFLQLIRVIVDNVAGESQFTLDPRRHRIVEESITLPPNLRHTHLLPDKRTAEVLVESFFTNTNGIVDIFNRRAFIKTLNECYGDPLRVDPSWLCLLYLVFSIGLVMAVPERGTEEESIIKRLRQEPADRAEIFFHDAKNLKDPSAGFEDGCFWNIQALTLMSVYMLAVSKRNAAYAYFGMAVRTAFALGLHREETMFFFPNVEDQAVRRNLWRSIFILDRFLSACLGRPTAIRESDCSGDTLSTGERAASPMSPSPNADTFPESRGLDASVRTCRVIGRILDQVYSQRRISTKIAQELVGTCEEWPARLDEELKSEHAMTVAPSHGIAILHTHLLHFHSVILLCRPFFLFLMYKFHQEFKKHGRRPSCLGSKSEKYAEACVLYSNKSIELVQAALESGYLPHRNPFVIYFLFAAGLVVLSNEFSNIFNNSNSETYIQNCINIMKVCAEDDPQARRLLFILSSFRDVVTKQRAHTSSITDKFRSEKAPKLGDSSFERGIKRENTDDTSRTSNFTPVSPARRKASIDDMLSTARPNKRPFHNPSPTASNSTHISIFSILDPNTSGFTAASSGYTAPYSARPANASSSTNTTNFLESQNSRFNDSNRIAPSIDIKSIPNACSFTSPDGSGIEEIDFETLWQWSGTGYTPGLTPGLVGTTM